MIIDRIVLNNQPSNMSKFTIFLCIVYFVSASDAFFLDNGKFEAAKQKAVADLEDLIDDVRTKFEVALKKAFERVEAIKTTLKEYKNKIIAEIDAIIQKASDEVDKLTTVSDDVDVSHCRKFVQQLAASSRSLIRNMTICLTDKQTEAKAYVDDMMDTAGNLHTNLTAHVAEARQCFADANDFWSGGRAIICADVVATKAVWCAAKTVPSTTLNLTGLANLLLTLQQSMTTCLPTRALATLHAESASLVQRTKECVKQKVDEIGQLG